MKTYFIGEILKAKREALGLSQQDVAKKVGYSTRQHISNIERGDSASIKTVLKIAKCLGVSKETIEKAYKKALVHNFRQEAM